MAYGLKASSCDSLIMVTYNKPYSTAADNIAFTHWNGLTYVTHHNKTGQLSVTKKNVIFLLIERAFYQLKDDTTHV